MQGDIAGDNRSAIQCPAKVVSGDSQLVLLLASNAELRDEDRGKNVSGETE